LTQPQLLNVEYEELMARADELEAPIPGQPVDNPKAPSALAQAVAAAQQLGLSADNMRLYVGVGEREWERLAESLRNAASAYEDVDDNAATAVDTGASVSAARVRLAKGGPAPTALGDRQPAATTPSADPPYFGYFDVREAAYEIRKGDQGLTFDRFADAWTAYRQSLLEATYRFQPFDYWDGDAAAAVEANFDQQRAWLYEMADLCGRMAAQAQDVASAQRWARPEHPTIEEILAVDYRWKVQGDQPHIKHKCLIDYSRYQQTSEEVLGEYARMSGLPLPPMHPPKPPVAYSVDPSGEPDPSRWPSPGQGLAGPTAAPMVPLTGAPSMPDEAGLVRAPGMSATSGPALKPASFGGGVGGGALTPLQFPADGGSVSQAAAGREVATNPSAGRAIGAGGMDTAPMGAPGAQGQGAGKDKRTQQDEESLYTETRPWSEGVIGLGRLRVVADEER
jgi:hypothetical protein